MCWWAVPFTVNINQTTHRHQRAGHNNSTHNESHRAGSHTALATSPPEQSRDLAGARSRAGPSIVGMLCAADAGANGLHIAALRGERDALSVMRIERARTSARASVRRRVTLPSAARTAVEEPHIRQGMRSNAAKYLHNERDDAAALRQSIRVLALDTLDMIRPEISMNNILF